ncbi:N-acetylmuramic acid 6-phosphate etherase [bacterium]|nr:N-acetylmuramic acid 6-phosphate etherase [bacterium]MBU1650928.1 N-acetylmuramic acid 6-phosphate etherase [bacterium]
MSRSVFKQIAELTTEQILPDALEIDTLSIGEILQLMSTEDTKVAPAVHAVLPQIEAAVEKVVASFQAGGRLIYIGAGTSGRLGIVDASECPPTFGTDPEQVTGIIAGGRDTVFLSKEGIEDDAEQGGRDLLDAGLTPQDTVVGIASSSRTPYVLGALKYAKRSGAATVFLMCNPPAEASAALNQADVIIAPMVGPEVIMGSTRLKAGTATKMILNMITTTAFIRCGKVYQGMMVDLKAWSEKLTARSRRVIMLAADLDYDQAGSYLEKAGGSVKTAIVMALCGVPRDTAEELLKRHGGFIRQVVKTQKK